MLPELGLSRTAGTQTCPHHGPGFLMAKKELFSKSSLGVHECGRTVKSVEFKDLFGGGNSVISSANMA